MRIYLDVCCLNRPFDDQSQARIRLESEAILFIIHRMVMGQWEWARSEIMDYEIDLTPDMDRRNKVNVLLNNAHLKLDLDVLDVKRAKELQKFRIIGIDALHIACAERADCDVFLTTDERLLRVAIRNASNLSVRVANPLDWLKEVKE